MISLLVAATFSFSASTRAHLVTAVAEAANVPVVVMGDGAEKMHAAKFDWTTPEDIRREVCHSFLLASEENGGFGFGTSAWPATILGRRVGARRTFQSVTVIDGKWNAEPGENGSVNVEALVGKFTKSTSVSWFLRRVPVTVSAHDGTDDQVRNALAVALGATVEGTDALTLTPKPDVFARRLINGYSYMAADPVLGDLRATAAFCAAIIRSQPMTKVQAMFATEGLVTTLPAPANSALYRAGVDFVKAGMASARADAARLNRMASEVDPRQPA